MTDGDEIRGVVRKISGIEERIVDGEDKKGKGEDEANGPDKKNGDQCQCFVEDIVNLEWFTDGNEPFEANGHDGQ